MPGGLAPLQGPYCRHPDRTQPKPGSAEKKTMRHTGQIVACIIVGISLFETGCQSRHGYQEVDFSRRVAVEHAPEAGAAGKTPVLAVAISSLLSAQESFSHYDELFTAIGRRCSMPVRITYCKDSREACRLFSKGAADLGFVGTATYIIGKRSRFLKMLVVPVVNGKSTFQAYIIVHSPSSIRLFVDLKGKNFAFTDRFSLAGYFYPLSRSRGNHAFLKKAVFAGSHDNAIELVQRGIVDGASVSGTVYEVISRDDPDKVDHVRVIEKSQDFGAPPIVVRAGLPDTLVTKLRNAFASLKSESSGWEMLQVLGIDTFTVTDDSIYDSAAQLVPDTIVP